MSIQFLGAPEITFAAMFASLSQSLTTCKFLFKHRRCQFRISPYMLRSYAFQGLIRCWWKINFLFIRHLDRKQHISK